MRALLLALVLLAGCRTAEIPASSDGGGLGGMGGGSGDLAGGSYDLSGALCVSACNRCLAGACCGPTCCAAGEWCDLTTFTCHCGQGAACSGANICASGGPIQPGGNSCGSICCGSGGNPCPL